VERLSCLLQGEDVHHLHLRMWNDNGFVVALEAPKKREGWTFVRGLLASVKGAYAVMMGLQIANTAGYTKRSVTSSGLFMGYCFGGPVTLLRNSESSNNIQETFSGRSCSRSMVLQAMPLDLLQRLARRARLRFYPWCIVSTASGKIRGGTSLGLRKPLTMPMRMTWLIER
jgi:hypothetical protein